MFVVSTLSSLQCFDTAGWEKERVSRPQKTCATSPQRTSSVSPETNGRKLRSNWLTWKGLPGKRPIKQRRRMKSHTWWYFSAPIVDLARSCSSWDGSAPNDRMKRIGSDAWVSFWKMWSRLRFGGDNSFRPTVTTNHTNAPTSAYLVSPLLRKLALLKNHSLVPNGILKLIELEMWANAQRDGRPAEHRWHPLFNAAKFGWRSLPDCRAVTLMPLPAHHLLLQ